MCSFHFYVDIKLSLEFDSLSRLLNVRHSHLPFTTSEVITKSQVRMKSIVKFGILVYHSRVIHRHPYFPKNASANCQDFVFVDGYLRDYEGLMSSAKLPSIVQTFSST